MNTAYFMVNRIDYAAMAVVTPMLLVVEVVAVVVVVMRLAV